jgi:hypothetical protein
LYEIQQQINFKLIQTFPKEHPYGITCLLQLNPNTLVSSSFGYSSDSDNVIVIWTKSPKSSPLYEPLQRIKGKEAGWGIRSLVLITQKKEEEEEEEVFASCFCSWNSIIIWRRGKGGKGDKFKIKQKITNVINVSRLLYISKTNELISGSSSPYLLHIWSPSPSSSSSSSDFVERQKIQTYSCIYSLCHLNENKNRIEFASGHDNGQIMIWSKQQQINESNHYSSIRTLHPFNNDNWVSDLIFLNDNGFDFLISCCQKENKIKIFKEEKEELEHKDVFRLIPMSNGQFASGGHNQCLNIWSTSSSGNSFFFIFFCCVKIRTKMPSYTFIIYVC